MEGKGEVKGKGESYAWDKQDNLRGLRTCLLIKRTSSKIPAVPEPKIRAAAVLLSPDEPPAALSACTRRILAGEVDEEEGVYMTD